MNEETSNQKDKLKASKLLKVIIAGIVIILIGVLFYLRSKNPETFTLFWMIIPIVVLLIVIAFIFFGKNIKQIMQSLFGKVKSKTEESLLIEPVEDKELFEIAKNIMKSENYENHIKKFNSTTPLSPSKNLIKAISCELLYEHKGSYECVVLINTQSIKRHAVLFEGDGKITEAKLKSYANALSISPEGDPDIKEVEEENVITGVKRKTKETVHPKKKKEDEGAKET